MVDNFLLAVLDVRKVCPLTRRRQVTRYRRGVNRPFGLAGVWGGGFRAPIKRENLPGWSSGLGLAEKPF